MKKSYNKNDINNNNNTTIIYRNEIRKPRDSEWDIVDKFEDTLEDRIASIRTKCLTEEARVSAKDIAEADKEIGLTTTEVGDSKDLLKNY